jgi:hypothetical protein
VIPPVAIPLGMIIAAVALSPILLLWRLNMKYIREMEIKFRSDTLDDVKQSDATSLRK